MHAQVRGLIIAVVAAVNVSRIRSAAFFLGVASVVFCGRLEGAPVDFVHEVRPIFEKHCYSCHGAEKQKSGLRLDVKSSALKGGEEHAPNIVPGNPKESFLFAAVSGVEQDLRMPPKGERLSPVEVRIIARWIEEGARWPDGVDSARIADNRAHWCFQPLAQPTPPVTADPSWPRNGLDRFILARLERRAFGRPVKLLAPRGSGGCALISRDSRRARNRSRTLKKTRHRWLTSGWLMRCWIHHGTGNDGRCTGSILSGMRTLTDSR